MVEFIYIYYTFPLAVWLPPNAACCKQFAKRTENEAESCKVKRLQRLAAVLFVFGNWSDLLRSLAPPPMKDGAESESVAGSYCRGAALPNSGHSGRVKMRAGVQLCRYHRK